LDATVPQPRRIVASVGRDKLVATSSASASTEPVGRANLGTTDIYLGRPRLDDMVAAVKDAPYGIRTNVLGVAQMAQRAGKATTGIEPV
jgi:hypothetical protein